MAVASPAFLSLAPTPKYVLYTVLTHDLTANDIHWHCAAHTRTARVPPHVAVGAAYVTSLNHVQCTKGHPKTTELSLARRLYPSLLYKRTTLVCGSTSSDGCDAPVVG